MTNSSSVLQLTAVRSALDRRGGEVSKLMTSSALTRSYRYTFVISCVLPSPVYTMLSAPCVRTSLDKKFFSHNRLYTPMKNEFREVFLPDMQNTHTPYNDGCVCGDSLIRRKVVSLSLSDDECVASKKREPIESAL